MVLTPDSPMVDRCARQYLSATPSTHTPLSPNQQIFPLTAQVNADDHLEIAGCDVVELVKQFGSPLYIVDEDTFLTACRQYRNAFGRYYPGTSQVVYASKAWNCLALCAIAAAEGLGVEVVSGGELYTAIQANVSADQLYLHGNNKSRSEIQMAIEAGCTIMVDNQSDLDILIDLAPGFTQPQPIMLRLTPGIECHTHEYIRTGHIDSKFGFDPNQLEGVFEQIAAQPGLKCIGLHAHIGSQIFELQPHHDLAEVMVQWMIKATQAGLPVNHLNIGGGLGICYTESDDPPSIDQWAKVVCEAVAAACDRHQFPLPTLMCEPGRSLIGSACITAYTIGSHKTIPQIRTYVAVDGGMSDNPRPITYQSLYRAVVANKMSELSTETVTIAGKHCESGDILIKSAQLPPTQTGDILVIPATGAYNYSMASNYNRLPRPAAILVKDGAAQIIIERETYQDLIKGDRLPHR